MGSTFKALLSMIQCKFISDAKLLTIAKKLIKQVIRINADFDVMIVEVDEIKYIRNTRFLKLVCRGTDGKLNDIMIRDSSVIDILSASNHKSNQPIKIHETVFIRGHWNQ